MKKKEELPVSDDKDQRPQAVVDVAGTGAAITEDMPKKFKRLRGTARHQCPTDALPAPGVIPGFGRMLVPVSSVALQWGISPRRVRQMLEQGRLDGQQRENGYWEVFYPFRYQFGTRVVPRLNSNAICRLLRPFLTACHAVSGRNSNKNTKFKPINHEGENHVC